MEYSNELLQRINNLEVRRINVKQEVKDINTEDQEIKECIQKYSSFKEPILLAIAKLVTYKEGKAFIPYLYKRYNLVRPYPPTYYDTIFVGLAFEDDINDFLNSKSENIERLLGLKQGYEIYQQSHSEIKSFQESDDNWIIKPYDLTQNNKENPRISFRFIPKHFDMILQSGVVYSHYDFEDFPYVQDFIIYLFNKQFENKEILKSNQEFNQALEEFISLDKNISKTK